MSINEACQVWIEQRIKEELEDGRDKSLREIGLVIAAEIEKVFEAKVNPGTILTKVAREAKRTVSNETPAENQEPPTVKGGSTGSIEGHTLNLVWQNPGWSHPSVVVGSWCGSDRGKGPGLSGR